MSRRPDRTAGVGSAEVLVALAISLTVLAAMLRFLEVQERALAMAAVHAEHQGLTRIVTDLFARELRMATWDPRGTALPRTAGPACPGATQGLVAAGATHLRFQQDLDASGAVDAAGEDVRWELVRNELRRHDGRTAAEVVARNVPAGGFQLRYFDASNPPVELGAAGDLTAAERDCVARVRVTLRNETAHPAPGRPPIAAVTATEVAVRNRLRTLP